MGQVLTKNDNQPVPRDFLLSEEYPYEGKSYNEIGCLPRMIINRSHRNVSKKLFKKDTTLIEFTWAHFHYKN